MRTTAVVQAEIADVWQACPSLATDKTNWTIERWRAGIEARRQWRLENPDFSNRLDALQLELQEIEAFDEKMRIEKRRLSALASSGIGQRALEAAESPTNTDAMVASKEWLGSGLAWLVLCGNAGTGKTVAATWCMRSEAILGRLVAFRRFSEISRLSGFGDGATEIDNLKRVDLLVVDDFATEIPNNWARQILLELLDFRHEQRLRTIITANFRDAAQARECLGARIADRIRQDGKVVFLNGASMRGAS